MITIALNILDIVQNSISAGSDEIKITVNESKNSDYLEIIIEDNGSGIPAAQIEKVTDPFNTSRTTRKTGLGLPLIKHHAILAGGNIEVRSSEGKGTIVKVWFVFSHIDRQPFGDIAGVLIILIAANPRINFLYKHKTDTDEYIFSTAETKKFLEIDNLIDNELLVTIREMIKENLVDIGVSELNI